VAAAKMDGESLHIPDTQTAVVLVSYGVLCQALGWIIISRNFHRVPASRVALILLLQPALTFVWDISFSTVRPRASSSSAHRSPSARSISAASGQRARKEAT
jgi:drug/metabolite transporter (DMT)-like permease